MECYNQNPVFLIMSFKKGENPNNLNIVLYSSFYNFPQNRLFYISKNKSIF